MILTIVAIGRHTCVECKKKSPETELNYSLISLSGWREQRKTDESGEVKSEWRCPDCWATHKRRTRAQTQVNLPSLGALREPRRKE